MTDDNNKQREFQIFVKPVGARCNLRCRYCYYLDKISVPGSEYGPLMSDEVLEKYVIQHIEASSEQTVFFSWHGGEPLLAGIDFYRKAVALQKKYIPSGRSVLNGIQTNGSLIDWDWGWFFKQEKFMVGISIDGPGDLHNHFRKSRNGDPTLQSVLKGYDILKRLGIMTEILCVVNSYNARFPLVVYDFFRELGAKFITFIPLVERRAGSPSGVSRSSVSPDDFGSFLISVFDEWTEKDIGQVKIQIFEEAARTAFGQGHTLCIFRENCGGVPVIEADGSFYSCDHFVNRENLVGNINSSTVAELLDSEKQHNFGLIKSQTLPRCCIECDVKSMCNGECPKNRFVTTQDGEPRLNYLCNGYKAFFRHCRPFVEAIAEEWKKNG
jgi:uncharacterized protein